MAFGGALLLLRAVRRERLRARLRDLEGVLDTLEQSHAGSRWLRPVAALGKIVSPSSLERVQKALAKAGFHSAESVTLYFGAKMFLLFIGLVGLGVALYPTELTFNAKALLSFTGAALLSFVPNLIVRVRRERRRAEIRHYFADVLDLLEICVSSGMGLELAWNSVADEVRYLSKTIGDEMALTDLEIHLGASRAVALRHMAERTGADEISSMVATLAQSERFGTSISDALRALATSMREARSLRASESAERMAVKLLFPLVFFVFPPVLIVSVGPAVIVITTML